MGKTLGGDDKGGSIAADMQTTGESSNGGSDGFTNDDVNGGARDLILEADGSGTLGDESPDKNKALAGEDKKGGTNGIGGTSSNADALDGVEGEGDEESGLEML